MAVSGLITRRKLARYLAQALIRDDENIQDIIDQIAAYSVETGKTREISLLVCDVEDILAENGQVVADLISAHALTNEDKVAIKEKLGAKKLYARETIDKDVLGGVKIETSSRRLDATLKRKIDLLKELSSKERTK